MQLSRQAGTTSQTIYVRIQDSSSSTGAGKTGLVFNTSSLTAYYVRRGGASTAITLVTQTVTGAWTSGGFVEVDSTNQPGLYRLDVPNACLAASADQVIITLRGASGMVDRPVLIELTAWNNQVANIGADVQTVKGQTTTCSAPIAIAPFVGNANAALAVDNTGRVDLGKILGTASAAPAGTVAMDWGATTNRTASVSLTATTLNLVTTTTTATNLTNAPTAGDFTAAMKTSAQTAAAAAITAASLATSASQTTALNAINAIKAKTDLIATNSADSANAVTAQGILNATASVIETDIPAIKAQTDQMQFDGNGFLQVDIEDVGGQHALSTGGQLWALSSAGNSVAEATAMGTPQQSGTAVTLPANPPSGFLITASYGTAPGWYTAPDNTSIASILTATGSITVTLNTVAHVGSAMTLASGAITNAVINNGALTSNKFSFGTVVGHVTGFLEMVYQLYYEKFGTIHKGNGTIAVSDNGPTLLITTPITSNDDGTVQTIGPPS